MFEKILYPTDFSDVSKKALGFIKQLREAGTQEVIVLHVIDQREIENVFRYARAYLEDVDPEGIRRETAEEETKAIERELKSTGFDVKIRIEKGIPLTHILEVEEEEDVSLVVIGSHGKSCVEEMFLGSVSENLVRKSNKPVLVVRR